MHTLTKSNIKDHIKAKMGDKYIDFMQDLCNVALTNKEVSEKWHVSVNSITRWIDILGYSRTASVKRQIRNAYKVERRVREREENTKSLIKFILTKMK